MIERHGDIETVIDNVSVFPKPELISVQGIDIVDCNPGQDLKFELTDDSRIPGSRKVIYIW